MLGYGCMRFPQKDGKIDYAAAEALIDTALESGVNYYDTAYMYHGGQSERFLRKALIERHDRSSYYVADKLPIWECKEEADCLRVFEEQLDRLGTDYIDYYLLHSLNAGNWESCKKLGAHTLQKELKRQGRIRYAGFSFHDSPEVLAQILNENEWDFCQLQLNYYDWDNGRAGEMYRLCEERGVPVIVMEPVRGGSLANMNTEIQAIFKEANPDASIASWAIRYVGSLDNVRVVLSGMTTMDQLTDNLKTCTNFAPLTPAERNVIDRVLEAFNRLPLVACTSCRYCEICPMGIDIPRAFGLYNEYVKFGAPWTLKGQYLKETPAEALADRCTGCRACAEICPQHLEIPELLKKVLDTANSL